MTYAFHHNTRPIGGSYVKRVMVGTGHCIYVDEFVFRRTIAWISYSVGLGGLILSKENRLTNLAKKFLTLKIQPLSQLSTTTFPSILYMRFTQVRQAASFC